MPVQSASGKTIQRLRTSGRLRIRSSSRSTANSVISISFTKKRRLNSYFCRSVALIGRAPDSKSGCWGFDSLLTCHFPAPKSGINSRFGGIPSGGICQSCRRRKYRRKRKSGKSPALTPTGLLLLRLLNPLLRDLRLRQSRLRRRPGLLRLVRSPGLQSFSVRSRLS